MAVAAAAMPVKSFADSSCHRLSSYPCLSSCKGRTVNSRPRRPFMRKLRMLDISSSFIAKMLITKNGELRKRQRRKGFNVVDELGGQYDDTFIDVKIQIMDYFTIKAVRTVLEQLYEMNSPQYKWFNNFVADNEVKKAKRFLQILVKERQDLAERVMLTRLTLYSRWIKKCDHEGMYKEIEEENLKLMRERLLETIIWPSDDHNNTKAHDANSD